MHTSSAFIAHPLLFQSDLQTLATRFFKPVAPPSEPWRIDLPGGDALAIMTSYPPGWREGDPIAILVHGLTGSSQSGYAVRMARLALARGAAAIRVNLRNAGEGAGLSRLPYHSGRSDDLRAVLTQVSAKHPASPMGLVGYSLGGNITLKLAGEAADAPVPNLRALAAVAAPIDLARCADALASMRNLIYDQFFVRNLTAEARAIARAFPDVKLPRFPRRMTLRRFDDLFTAPRSGFRDAADYYAKSSSGPLLRKIAIPTLLMTAQDDPFVPFACYQEAALSPAITARFETSGGHCGFIGPGFTFWAEERAIDFLFQQWASA